MVVPQLLLSQLPPTVTFSDRGKIEVIVRREAPKHSLLIRFQLAVSNDWLAIPPWPGVVVEGKRRLIAGRAGPAVFAIPH